MESSEMYPKRLAALGLRLPSAPLPAANYIPARRHGALLFVSGQLPFVDGKLPHTGRLGAEVDVVTARNLCQLAALNALAVANAEVGSLARVSVVNLMIFVASTARFYEQHLVGDGASDLFIAVLGDAGQHARTTVATPTLPLNSPVEVQVVFGLN